VQTDHDFCLPGAWFVVVGRDGSRFHAKDAGQPIVSRNAFRPLKNKLFLKNSKPACGRPFRKIGKVRGGVTENPDDAEKRLREAVHPVFDIFRSVRRKPHLGLPPKVTIAWRVPDEHRAGGGGAVFFK
jgi:hypothetical protein